MIVSDECKNILDIKILLSQIKNKW